MFYVQSAGLQSENLALSTHIEQLELRLAKFEASQKSIVMSSTFTRLKKNQAVSNSDTIIRDQTKRKANILPPIKPKGRDTLPL